MRRMALVAVSSALWRRTSAPRWSRLPVVDSGPLGCPGAVGDAECHTKAVNYVCETCIA